MGEVNIMKTPSKAIINYLFDPDQLSQNKANFWLRIGTIFYSFLLLLMSGCVNPVKSQTFSQNDQIKFYGNDSSPQTIGADYFIFRENGNQIEGLIYVQNSDVFSCVNGSYNSQLNQVENVIFSYPEMGTDHWETFNSDDPIKISDFPYQFNYNQINQDVNSLFAYCLER